MIISLNRIKLISAVCSDYLQEKHTKKFKVLTSKNKSQIRIF